jgi:serine protease
MSVAAVDANMNKAGFSQFNDQIEIAGPGVAVLSTFPPNTYQVLSGTSMACPYVAGVAADVWSYFPDCTNNQIRNVLLKTALDRGAAGYDIGYGHGIVQAKAAYDLLQSEGCEAGGDAATVTPLSGCAQNPNYSASQCLAAPSTSGAAAQMVLSLGSSIFLYVSTMWIFLSAT